MIEVLFMMIVITAIFFGIFIWVDKQCIEIKYGPKYHDYGGTEDFSSRNEYDEKDPWSMFRETK